MIIAFDDITDIRNNHSDQKVVLTSGTFDLLHVGHLNYLEKVRKFGDVVVVLLSGDQRVKSRKGSKRPIINENDRARILDNLKIVDYVFVDPSKMRPDETDPIHAEILQKLNPDFYITDEPDPRFYDLMDKPKFIILDRMNPEPSTTSIINRILELEN
jgi:D-beta-D-heptose 7-phosphate kinase/D-beta-D-heptose 1-phosphate adenosyltransferase